MVRDDPTRYDLHSIPLARAAQRQPPDAPDTRSAQQDSRVQGSACRIEKTPPPTDLDDIRREETGWTVEMSQLSPRVKGV